MADKVSIKVSVGGRSYPLTVAQKDEALITEIAQKLNSTITALQSNYSVKDKQDLIAMAALQVATKASLAANKADDSGQVELDDLTALMKRSKHLV